MTKHIVCPLLLALALILYGGARTATCAQTGPDPHDCYLGYISAHPDLVVLGDNTTAFPSTISTSSALLATTIPTVNNYFFVAGTFTIDQSVSFSTCTFLMAPYAKIVVNAATNLTLVADTLKAGCFFMWEGIYANNSTTTPSVVTIRGCHIHDMLYGVEVEASSNILDASTSQFINNERSIYLNGALATYSGAIRRNSFFSTGSLLLPPHSGELGDKAIEIFMCKSAVVGDKLNTGQGNEFTDLNCGIHIHNSSEVTISSDIYLVDNNFTGITGVSFGSSFNPVTSYMGAGIWGEVDAGVSTVHVWGLVKAGDSRFKDCDKGIMLDRINSDITQVQMDNVVYGIATDNSATSHNISANLLYGTYYGIYIHGTPASGLGITIDNNTITTNSQLAYRPFPGMAPLELAYPRGIWVENGTTGSTNTFNIRINRINVMANKGTGIEMYNMGALANTELN